MSDIFYIAVIILLAGLCLWLWIRSRRNLDSQRDAQLREDLAFRQRLSAEQVERERILKTLEGDRVSQTRFLEHLSHELRTPLHALANYTAFLREDFTSDPPNLEGTVRQLDQVDKHVQRLGRLIEHLEVLAKLQGRSAADFTQVSLSLLMSAKAFTFRDWVSEQQISISWSEPPEEMWVRGDETLLRLLAQNLFENAVTACKSGDTIEAGLHEMPGSVVFTLRDNGAGIAPDELEKLFLPFQKTTDAISEERDGSGLGLYLCKLIVELHGGNIALRSDGRGTGSTVIVELPRFIPTPMESES